MITPTSLRPAERTARRISREEAIARIDQIARLITELSDIRTSLQGSGSLGARELISMIDNRFVSLRQEARVYADALRPVPKGKRP